MTLKEVRKSGIDYCQETKNEYTYISYDDANKFQLTDKENNHTVFLVNRNGSLKPYLATKYAMDFHKELKRRKKNRRTGKKDIADMSNTCDVGEDGAV